MTWYRKLRIWWWNCQINSTLHELAYWHMQADGTHAEETQIKFDKLIEIRNAYAYKYNLKPSPNTPEDWRERYEQVSTTQKMS